MYRHTQIGWVLIAIIAPVILIMGFWSVLNPVLYGILAAIALLIVLILFGSLTVTGNELDLVFYFGPGIINRHIRYDNIQWAKKVRNRWYFGWGVRWYGRGWLYNVSGLDAIEIRLRNGKMIRIGTDEPDKLIEFLSTRIGRPTPL